MLVLLVCAGCVSPVDPAPAEERSTPPPWGAPRDAVSFIEAAGLEVQPTASRENSHVTQVDISIDHAPVQIPAYVGVDRVRAQQAGVHTHDASGQVWLEGRNTADITLGQFFTVWGVRFDGRCLGAACHSLAVTVDGSPLTSDPRAVRLSDSRSIAVTAMSRLQSGP